MPRPSQKSRATPARPARSKPAKRSSDVEAFLDDLKHPQREVIDALRRLIRRAVPGAAEEIKWNAPSFATTEHFATFHLRGRQGVQLVLHLGAKPRPGVDLRKLVTDAEGLLEWKGRDRAIITIGDRAKLRAVGSGLTRILKEWARQVG